VTKNYDPVKKEIISKFNKNVKGFSPVRPAGQETNGGWEGDWLTKKMGLKKNGKNEPDFKGFEMKKNSSKITFGDWSPTYSIFKSLVTREDFLKIFGSKKSGRSSWSGTVFPKIGSVTRGGQEIFVNKSGAIEIVYSYSKDKRKNKDQLVPLELRVENLQLCIWEKSTLTNFIFNKYGKHGYFILSKNDDNIYTKITFGPSLNYETFIVYFKKGVIFLDCGMFSGNPRPYMTFRAVGDFWFKLASKRLKVRS